MSDPFPTIGGVVTRGETYAKLLHHLSEAQNLCCVMAHLHQTEGNEVDSLLAKGWLGMAELYRMNQQVVTKMAMGRMQ